MSSNNKGYKPSASLQKALDASNLSEKKNKPGYFENKETGREIKLSPGGNYYQKNGTGGHIPTGGKKSL
jgi:hypothetical protein